MNDRLKEKLILNRLDRIYCKLAPSKIHGIGVFAIKPIFKGINPFKDSYIAQDAILVNKSKIKDEIIKSLLNDYHPNDDNNDQIISSFPNQPLWTNYINYSDNPNIELMENGEWETIRQINIGEELLENPKSFFNKDGTRKIYKVTTKQYPSLHY
jgi:SET domain-containing protein